MQKLSLKECKGACFILLALGGKKRKRVVQTEIANKLGISQQSVSRILKELEEKGLITRIVKGRGEFIEVTDRGLALIEKMNSLATLFLKEEKDTLVLEGIVEDGLGEGRFYMSISYYRDMIKKTLGFNAYPGTLNIRLVGENIWKRKTLDAFPGIQIPGFKNKERFYGGARVFPAKINGYQPAGIILPDRTSHPQDILEVIAPIYLRGELGLKTGDRVVLEINLVGQEKKS